MSFESLNEGEKNAPDEPNTYRSILPDMVTVSNNSKLTTEMAIMLAKSLDKEDFRKFKLWLNHSKNQQHIKVASATKNSGNDFRFQ